ncbi:glycoside hydrolase family 5 protein [Pedobacter jejuensis]|uniref:Glycoside hydrolase family 5 protein n=1 Tax=Pedobacter jejuensis TaxID=1268550 RepID=A0A3N0C1F4_9SPHI|nr:glycoside hydrolase family 5 protein [Pedobacter jejuensis]RNL55894.1 glycoside hydrolase family 5 protein [Pedobacter jejuensis]
MNHPQIAMLKISFKASWLAMILAIISLQACSKNTNTATPIPPVVVLPPPVSTEVPQININATTAKEIILDMGTGFNLGNTFESNFASNPPILASVKPIIDTYYNAGMRHIRIPVTWMQGYTNNIADGNGMINPTHPRLLELKAIIEYALAKKMYVEINAHHEHWLKDFYDGSAGFDNKFKTLWTGIANYFKDQPKQLIFDVLNEPEGKMGQWSSPGNPLPTDPSAIALTRQILKVDYDAIRATGGNNSTRIIMIEPNGQGNQGQIEEVFSAKANLPGGGNDAYIAIQVHSYDPWAFCGQTGANSAFPGNSTFTSAIQKVASHSAIIDVPVNYGEFGVGRTSGNERNTDLVRGYYRLMKQTIIAQKMSCTVWDDKGWFGLTSLTGSTPTFSNNIVPFMMNP